MILGVSTKTIPIEKNIMVPMRDGVVPFYVIRWPFSLTKTHGIRQLLPYVLRYPVSTAVVGRFGGLASGGECAYRQRL
jgi:hypothetical protein